MGQIRKGLVQEDGEGVLKKSAGGGPQRTANMPNMVVTREVFQLEMSALNFLSPLKSSLMSVMAETSQPAMGPYFASAEAGSSLKASTAAFRVSLLVNL